MVEVFLECLVSFSVSFILKWGKLWPSVTWESGQSPDEQRGPRACSLAAEAEMQASLSGDRVQPVGGTLGRDGRDSEVKDLLAGPLPGHWVKQASLIGCPDGEQRSRRASVCPGLPLPCSIVPGSP